MTIAKIFFISAALLMFGSVRAADLVGKWAGEFDSPVGHQKYEFEFKKEGDKLTGKAKADIGGDKHNNDLKEIKLDGDQVKFVEPLEFQGNSITITYTGKISGDQIKFKREVGEFAVEEFVAKRVPPAKPDAVEPPKR